MEIPTSKSAILHICSREMLRPLRDQILRNSGFEVDSCLSFTGRPFAVLGSPVRPRPDRRRGRNAIHDAEHPAPRSRPLNPSRLIAFVCNWRVALQTDCPDEILRTEFNPQAFVDGVKDMIPPQA